MTEFITYDLETSKKYKIDPVGDQDANRFYRTVHNLNKMLLNGNPITVVVPTKQLDKDGLEEYRRFFCSYAKQIKRNCIYFEGPIVLTEL